jgi:acetyltransferase AlgX (SGNH hydrolase-like protein)
VNQDQVFVQLLEDRLNATTDTPHYRALNAGSNGWSTANELIFLTEEGFKYQPDLVVVAAYVGNDMVENFRQVALRGPAAMSQLTLDEDDSFAGARAVLRDSRAYSFLESGVLAKFAAGPSRPDAEATTSRRADPETAQDAQAAWQITKSLLARMQREVNAHGARLMVMIIPTASDVAAGRPKPPDPEHEPGPVTPTPGFEEPERALAEICSGLGLPTVNLLPAFRHQAGRSNERVYFRVNAHWTAAGHALAADALYSFMQDRGLLR